MGPVLASELCLQNQQGEPRTIFFMNFVKMMTFFGLVFVVVGFRAKGKQEKRGDMLQTAFFIC